MNCYVNLGHGRKLVFCVPHQQHSEPMYDVCSELNDDILMMLIKKYHGKFIPRILINRKQAKKSDRNDLLYIFFVCRYQVNLLC